MRLAYVLLGMFLLFAGIRAQARELRRTEALVLTPLNKTLVVKDYMIEELEEMDLSFIENVKLRSLKLGCNLIEAAVAKIEAGDEDYPNQAVALRAKYTVCSEGALLLTHFYIKQRSLPE